MTSSDDGGAPPIARPGDGRVPPGQRVTDKFPVMTAGTPRVAKAADWTLTLAREFEDGREEALACWRYPAIRERAKTVLTTDIHCVTRWSKLDTRWRGVTLDALLEACAAPGPDTVEPGGALPLKYLRADCDGDYSANLRRADLTGDAALIALDYDAGDGLAPLAEPHGGPARLLVPALYFWKSAKWVRRLVLTPYDRKGFWERLGYHNYGDPWREQRYRGLSDGDWRRTLDTDLSREIRLERLGAKVGREPRGGEPARGDDPEGGAS